MYLQQMRKYSGKGPKIDLDLDNEIWWLGRSEARFRTALGDEEWRGSCWQAQQNHLGRLQNNFPNTYGLAGVIPRESSCLAISH
jgi:hypothetical protein